VDIKYIVGYKKSHSENVYELKKNKLLSFLESKTRFNVISLVRFIRAFLLANDIDFGAAKEILEHPWYKNAGIVQLHNLHGNFFKFDTLSRIASEKPTVWTLHDGWALTAHCAHCYDCKKYNNGKHFTPGLRRYGAMLWNNSEYLWNTKKRIYANSPKLNIVTPSQWLANRVKYSILKGKSLTVINNGIDVNVFKPRDKNRIRRELRLPTDKILIAYVAQMGTLDPRKGGTYFLETAKYFLNNPNIIFLCIGGIIGNKNVQKENIIYMPFISDKEELSHYYSSADLFLFTSLAENFPLVTLEAMASGLPVIGFDVGGVKEQVKHKVNGYIAKYKDSKELIVGINYFLNLNHQSFHKVCEIDRKKTLQSYTVEIMTKKYLALYKSLKKRYY